MNSSSPTEWTSYKSAAFYGRPQKLARIAAAVGTSPSGAPTELPRRDGYFLFRARQGGGIAGKRVLLIGVVEDVGVKGDIEGDHICAGGEIDLAAGAREKIEAAVGIIILRHRHARAFGIGRQNLDRAPVEISQHISFLLPCLGFGIDCAGFAVGDAQVF